MPKEAWQRLTEEEAQKTDQRKREASKEGQQYVSNTEEAREAREESLAPPLSGYDTLSVEEVERKAKGLSYEDYEEVERIRDYERRNRARKTLLQALDGMLGD